MHAAAPLTVSIAAGRGYSVLDVTAFILSAYTAWSVPQHHIPDGPCSYLLMQICQISWLCYPQLSTALDSGIRASQASRSFRGAGFPGAMGWVLLDTVRTACTIRHGPDICRPSVYGIHNSRVTCVSAWDFHFVFMMGYSMSFANSMTCALNTLDPEFKADGNAALPVQSSW